MISEERLVHILNEMEFYLALVAKELDPQKLGVEGIVMDGQFISFKYMQHKVAAIKSHMDWIRVEIEENRIASV